MCKNIFTVQHGRESFKKPCYREETHYCCDQNIEVKCSAICGTSSSASLGEPSIPLVCDTEDTKKDSGNVVTHIWILWQNLS